MFKIFKDPFFIAKISIFQNIISFILTLFPFSLQHNFGKYSAIRKAFYLSSLEGISGDYYEFGVFTGSSFCHAMRTYKSLGFFNRNPEDVTFYGFDSFKGFDEKTSHPFFQNSNFQSNYNHVNNRIKKISKRLKINYLLTEGYFSDSLKKFTKPVNAKASIIFIDCDLYLASKVSLNFCTSLIQDGTIILIDDFYSFKGSNKKSPYAAFKDWIKENQFNFRVVNHYGIGGVVIIMHNNDHN